MDRMGAMKVSEVQALVGQLREVTASRRAYSRRFRLDQLKGIKALVRDHTQELQEALYHDLGKAPFESTVTEISVIKNEVDYAILHVSDWMEPESVRMPLAYQPATGTIRPRPKGQVLIIGPWNYPVQLVLAPLVAAVSAGNTAVLKPSEKAPATADVLARLIPEYLDPSAVAVVQGGAEVVQALLAEKWDHIFYTGGERVGRIVYEAAAQQLTPVTLELGGKSPAVVSDGPVATIAKRLAWGKFVNAGQTCVAPDYVLAVGDQMRDKLEAELPKVIDEFYESSPESSLDYGRLISAEHTQRLVEMLQQTLDAGAELITGGGYAIEERYLAPTVISRVAPDTAVMAEEIFGPILPIVTVKDIDEAMAFIGERPHPLAAYLFTDRARVRREFEERVVAGSMGFDAPLLQISVPGLPFGGVGPSGIGNYHGKYGFDTFTHFRAEVSKTDQLDTLKAVYPPYGWAKKQFTKRVL
ncbi:aldehyde dehydrogenase family protein [Auritidibacter sp. NML120636]|nr:aldehyde dehydrogenase family protein [Auritidibacter sp. NML120636]